MVGVYMLIFLTAEGKCTRPYVSESKFCFSQAIEFCRII